MSNYVSYLHEQAPLTQRFSLDGDNYDNYGIQGLELWEAYIALLLEWLAGRDLDRRFVFERLRGLSGGEMGEITDEWFERPIEELIVMLLLNHLRRAYTPLRGPGCPRVFISHRQSDWQYALRIAQLAEQSDLAYWIDILEPALQLIVNHRLPYGLIPLLTACIIEMALINCTHVIACMTPDTRGSLWLPYEYGRLTKIPGFERRAACWVHPDLEKRDFPEYMHLGQIFQPEQQIVNWMTTEKAKWASGRCRMVKGLRVSVPALPE